MSLIVL